MIASLVCWSERTEEDGVARIVLATSDEALRLQVSGVLQEAGYAVGFAATWTHAIAGLTRSPTRLLLVDAHLPDLAEHGAVLLSLAATLEHRPTVVAIGGPVPGIETVSLHPVALRARVSKVVGTAVSKAEARLLRLFGVGSRPLHALSGVARTELSVCILGEKGTGKKRVAEVVHRLGGGGPFLSLKPQGNVSLPLEEVGSGGSSGTLYLGLQDEWPMDQVIATHERARAAGWRFVIGARVTPPVALEDWVRLVLRPLRERSDDLRALTLHYVDAHRRAMGLPRRRMTRGMWPLILGYPWPGNARELEAFVISLLSAVDRPSIHARDLPPSVRTLVDPRRVDAFHGEAIAFEDLVERQLRRVVTLFEPGGAPTLYDLVRNAVERPLFRLALARCAGSQKAAAAFLGISRNTLHSHLEDLGLRPH